MEIELLSTAGCHLCDVAEQVLLSVLPGYAPRVSCYVLDIADDDALIEQYGTRIPVLRAATSTLELSWPFDEAALRQFLDTLL